MYFRSLIDCVFYSYLLELLYKEHLENKKRSFDTNGQYSDFYVVIMMERIVINNEIFL